ncbi:MAG: LysM peptidoglycan-binding domain-containing protein [Actinomycetota bacterium]
MTSETLTDLMAHVSVACLAYLLAYAVRIRVRRRPRVRWSLPGPLARLTSLLGLTMALASLPSPARADTRSRLPRPRGRVLDPPWTAPASPPPHQTARIQVGSPHPSGGHPAIHRTPRTAEDGSRARCRLFPRACNGYLSHHVVLPGESLWTIAEKWLDTNDPEHIAQAWPRIYRANKAAIGPDPNLVRPGQVLELPDPRSL